MPVTSVYTDQTEYSRYHSDLSIINATIEVSSPVAGQILTVALNRLDGYGVVSTKTVTLTAATSYVVSFDLNKDAYDQTSPIPIYRAKQGDYMLNVTDSSNNVTSSAMFAISIVPVREMREEWTKGVTFYDYEILEPVVQPQNITGVTVIEVSANHYKGPFELVFTLGTPSTLAWNGGQAVNINGPVPVDLLLMDNQGADADFIRVHVVPLQLPTTNQNDTLYIDNGRIKDRAFIDQIRRATTSIQNSLITKLEPEVIDTDPGTGFCDEVGPPDTYIRPRTYNKWMQFQLPCVNVLDVESMTGWFNRGQVATIPRDWYQWSEKTGQGELVPSNSAQVVWSFYNGIFVMSYLYNYASIPGFFHYRLTAGLRDLWNERAIVREAIAKKAAIELLNSAGSAYRAGYASQSTSRDGVSQSEGYTSSATFGTYGGHFTSYKDWLKEEIPKIKKRLVAIQVRSI